MTSTDPLLRRFGQAEALGAHDDSDVQQAGARAAMPNAGTWRRVVLEVLKAAGAEGRTFDELCDGLGRNYSQIGPRVRELVRDGYARKAGRTRAGSSGAQQEIWVAQ